MLQSACSTEFQRREQELPAGQIVQAYSLDKNMQHMKFRHVIDWGMSRSVVIAELAVPVELPCLKQDPVGLVSTPSQHCREAAVSTPSWSPEQTH